MKTLVWKKVCLQGKEKAANITTTLFLKNWTCDGGDKINFIYFIEFCWRERGQGCKKRISKLLTLSMTWQMRFKCGPLISDIIFCSKTIWSSDRKGFQCQRKENWFSLKKRKNLKIKKNENWKEMINHNDKVREVTK